MAVRKTDCALGAGGSLLTAHARPQYRICVVCEQEFEVVSVNDTRSNTCPGECRRARKQTYDNGYNARLNVIRRSTVSRDGIAIAKTQTRECRRHLSYTIRDFMALPPTKVEAVMLGIMDGKIVLSMTHISIEVMRMLGERRGWRVSDRGNYDPHPHQRGATRLHRMYRP